MEALQRSKIWFFCRARKASLTLPWYYKIWNRVDCQRSEKRSKTMLFNWTKQDKTCKFSRKSSFSSYVQQQKTIDSTYLVSVGGEGLAEGKEYETDSKKMDTRPTLKKGTRLNLSEGQSRALFLLPASYIQLTQDKLNSLLFFFLLLLLCCTYLEKEDFLENLHVLFCCVQLKSVLLISCVFWVVIQWLSCVLVGVSQLKLSGWPSSVVWEGSMCNRCPHLRKAS